MTGKPALALCILFAGILLLVGADAAAHEDNRDGKNREIWARHLGKCVPHGIQEFLICTSGAALHYGDEMRDAQYPKMGENARTLIDAAQIERMRGCSTNFHNFLHNCEEGDILLDTMKNVLCEATGPHSDLLRDSYNQKNPDDLLNCDERNGNE